MASICCPCHQSPPLCMADITNWSWLSFPLGSDEASKVLLYTAFQGPQSTDWNWHVTYKWFLSQRKSDKSSLVRVYIFSLSLAYFIFRGQFQILGGECGLMTAFPVPLARHIYIFTRTFNVFIHSLLPSTNICWELLYLVAGSGSLQKLFSWDLELAGLNLPMVLKREIWNRSMAESMLDSSLPPEACTCRV